jgi:arylsulfatase A-like enzyme
MSILDEEGSVANKSRPNILWVSFEDVNPFYGCYGDSIARTPNVDHLVVGGCRWPNTFSTAGVCAPARSAVITGMYPISIGTLRMRTRHTHLDSVGRAEHGSTLAQPARPRAAILCRL